MSSAWFESAWPPRQVEDTGVDRRAILWAVLGIMAVWFLTLDYRHLLRSDEGRYAEIAREMFASGDWVTIRYNGLKYFEKPPFHLWMTALAYEVFGVGDWQARLWVALSGIIGAGATMLAALRWFGGRVAALCGLVLVAIPSWNLAGHFNSLDMSVSAAMACTLASLLIAQHPEATPTSRRRWMLAAYAGMAVAVLTKGLIGLALPGLVLIVYSLVARDWRLWTRLHIAPGLALFLLLCAPWFLLVSRRNPEFAQFFFIHEHWQRYTSTIHLRSAPVWYFVPQLLLGFLPWLGLVPAMVRGVRQERLERASGSFRPLLMLATWAVVIFAFFSASSSKLPGYIVPIFPALALLAAVALDRFGRAAWHRQLTGLLVLAALGLAGSVVMATRHSAETTRAEFQHYAVWLAVACIVALAGLWFARRLNASAAPAPRLAASSSTSGGPGRVVATSPFKSIATASLTLLAAVTIGLLGHETLGRSTSGIDLVPPIEQVLTPDMPIYAVRMLDHTLPFYLRRTTIMVEMPDELEFGTQQEPQKWEPTLAGFTTRWTSGPRAIAIMSHDTFKTLQADRLPMFPVAEDTRRVVVTNQPKAAP